MKRLHEQEIAAVLKTDGPTRYGHFVGQVADWEAVWGLRTPDGWVSGSDETNGPMFPVWPHEPYARMLAVDLWANATPTPIAVHDWIEKWLPGLARDRVMVAVFPTPEGKIVLVDPLQLRSDIEAELARIE
ncbi:hypothetical protein J2W30_005875 [Variovorax boronicumulans]|uniref:DUF2750 domain-containing protein n=1 Tax=Variovorax TaxID=34072 RepID=UPI00277FF951|nr:MULTISPECIES: DUF2750 domain-containing protein [Variovorax]MDQ0038088.1 hypothetical protein [Variovorax boronicumulans]MDQ0606249.1 hypothetical protein [Variovorax sp. W1I1]